MTEDNQLRWGVTRRFEFIEWRVYWTGKVNRRDLEDQFQISTPQASADFTRYQGAAPGNIEYDTTEKSYVATSDFWPKFMTLSPQRYLLQLQAITTEAIRKEDTLFDSVPTCDIAPSITRGPEAYVLRAVVQAIQQRGNLSINYQSLTKIGVREICPHALGYDGYRWHVRALSLSHGEYRDYVLGRIRSVSSVTSSQTDHSLDLEWHTPVVLNLVPHPQLDEAQSAAIAHDYRLQNGRLAIQMRLALAFYFIKRNNLDLRRGEITPERAQLYLENHDEIVDAGERIKAQSKALITQRMGATTSS